MLHDFTLTTTAGKDAWASCLEPGAADAAVRKLQTWLASRVPLHRSLALLLEAALPADKEHADVASSSQAPVAIAAPAAPAATSPATPPLQQTVPSAEALVTILTSRSLAGGKRPPADAVWSKV